VCVCMCVVVACMCVCVIVACVGRVHYGQLGGDYKQPQSGRRVCIPSYSPLPPLSPLHLPCYLPTSSPFHASAVWRIAIPSLVAVLFARQERRFQLSGPAGPRKRGSRPSANIFTTGAATPRHTLIDNLGSLRSRRYGMISRSPRPTATATISREPRRPQDRWPRREAASS